jgi:DNA-binding response OmpR family regulator
MSSPIPSPPVVLVVDDAEEELLLFERYLTEAGYRVLTAANGRTALRRVKLVRPDLILLDVAMPGMDGYEVCAQLQRSSDTALVPVIFCTALSDEQNKSRALAVGAADYLVKPVRRETLLAIVRTHLETRARWSLVLDTSALPGEERFHAFCAELIDSLPLRGGPAEELRRLRPEQLGTVAALAALSEEELARRAASFVGLTYLEQIDADAIHLSLLPPAFCRARGVVPLTDASLGLLFAIANPFVWNPADVELLTRAAQGHPYRQVVVPGKVLGELFGEAPEPLLALPRTDPGPRRLTHLEASATSDQVLDALRRQAEELGSPEVLLQPCEDAVRVRYRVNGRLASFGALDPSQLAALARRLAEGPVPGLTVERLRTAYGEQLFLRFERAVTTLAALEELGLEAATLAGFRRMLELGEGLILLTGRARSGRTTTLHAALRSLDPESCSQILIEDRASAGIAGAARVLVTPERCAAAVEEAAEQRLDVIAADALRTPEAGEAACRAALSGSLVLAVLTAGPVESLDRLGASAALARAAVVGTLSHLLLPRVCESCALPHEPDPGVLAALTAGGPPSEGGDACRFRKGLGCPRCGGAGIRGGVPLFSFRPGEEALRDLYRQALRRACEGLVAPEQLLPLAHARPPGAE